MDIFQTLFLKKSLPRLNTFIILNQKKHERQGADPRSVRASLKLYAYATSLKISSFGPNNSYLIFSFGMPNSTSKLATCAIIGTGPTT